MQTFNKKVIILLKASVLLLFLAGFSASGGASIHEHFTANKYFKGEYIYVINDSLKLHFKAPGDFDFITDKRVVGKQIRKHLPFTPENVLVYGVRRNELNYELWVTVNPVDEYVYTFPGNDKIAFSDIISEGLHFRFHGIADRQEDMDLIREELRKILNTLKTGDNYLRQIPETDDL